MTRLASINILTALLIALPACDGGDKEDTKAAEPAKVDTASAADEAEASADEAAPQAKAEPESKAKGDHYGAPLTDAPVLAIADLLAEPRKYEGKLVRVEGMVTGVCTKRGCWFDLAGNQPGQKVKFKVKDGTMVFPPDCKGKQAVAEGEVIVKELTLEQSVAQAKHMAEDAGKEFDPASVTEPTTLVMLDGKGATISVKS